MMLDSKDVDMWYDFLDKINSLYKSEFKLTQDQKFCDKLNALVIKEAREIKKAYLDKND